MAEELLDALAPLTRALGIAPPLSAGLSAGALLFEEAAALGRHLRDSRPLPYEHDDEGALRWWDDPVGLDESAEKRPGLLQRDDGERLLYQDALNFVYGLPGCGKSWVTLLAAKDALDQGGRVLLWNWEDTIGTVGRRARVLGALDMFRNPDRFRHVTSVNLKADGATENAQSWLGEHTDRGRPALVVIDTTGASGCPQDGSDIYGWLAEHVNSWRAVGATVLCVDHIPKRPEQRPKGPIGAQAKLAAVDGSALLVGGTPWTQRHPGRIYLVVEKDRHGEQPAAAGQVVAVIRGDYDSNGAFKVAIDVPRQEDEAESGDSENGDIADELLRALAATGPEGVVGSRKLRGLVKGRGADVDAAAEWLAHVGLIRKEPAGNGQGWRYVANEGVQEALEITSGGGSIMLGVSRVSDTLGHTPQAVSRRGPAPKGRTRGHAVHRDTDTPPCRDTPRGPLTRCRRRVAGTVAGSQMATHNRGRGRATDG